MYKLRLDFYLGFGVKPIEGDGIWCSSNGEVIVTGAIWYLVNSGGFDWRGVYISNFTERENKGVQPVPDGFPVVVTFKDGSRISSDRPEIYRWNFVDALMDVKSWKPDYEKLLEMQKEHDSKQEKPIEELMINAKESKMSNVFTQEMKDNGELPKPGMLCRTTDQEWFFVGVKKSGSWVLESKATTGMKCFLSMQVEPYKSKEELELEEAKDKQVNQILDDLLDTKMMKFNKPFTKKMIEIMQEKGMLAEIVLPLEGV